jgi:hypothetical protein
MTSGSLGAFTALIALATPMTHAASARSPSNALIYSTASPAVVQPQPSAGTCHARGSGVYSEADPHCTPGALNPAVTQATIATTICAVGWTRTVRPSERVTGVEKRASMAAYVVVGPTSAYEYDHLVPLELGGAINDPRNLWPEPDYPGVSSSSFFRNPKDHLEDRLKRLVCDGQMPLGQAQRLIVTDWAAAYRQIPSVRVTRSVSHATTSLTRRKA